MSAEPGRTMELKFNGKIKTAKLPGQKRPAEQAVLRMPTLMGVESACKQELTALGFEAAQITVSDASVALTVPWEEMPAAVAALNLNLRTAERVLLHLIDFNVQNFADFIAAVDAVPFEKYLDPGYFIDIVGYSRDSKLSSVPALQRLLKKAVIKRLQNYSPAAATCNVNGIWEENRNLGSDRLQFSLVRDKFSLDLDTSGEALYKRSYRPLNHPAPIRETLAAAILYFAHFLPNCENYREVLFDPVCGSGTFLIEAALLLTHTAPGLKRAFRAEKMRLVGENVFLQARKEAESRSYLYAPPVAQQPLYNLLFGADIDKRALKSAQENAQRAGVSSYINWMCADLTAYASGGIMPFPQVQEAERVLVLANPPYGERLGDEVQVARLHRAFKQLLFQKKEASVAAATAQERRQHNYYELKKKYRFSLITHCADLEKQLSCKANKRRKLYNGMLPCTLYQYF